MPGAVASRVGAEDRRQPSRVQSAPHQHAVDPDIGDLRRQLSRLPTAARRLAVNDLNERMGNRALTRVLAAGPSVSRSPVMSLRRAPATYPGHLTTDRVQEPGHLRISEYASDPTQKTAPGEMPSLTEIFWVDFRVDAAGTLRVSARTVDETGRYRSPTLALGPEFAKAIEYFKAKDGKEVDEFMADWSWMSPTEMSTNLATYTSQRKGGATPETAARATPSGKIATGLGFTEVNVVSDQLEKIEDIGDGREYQRVQVSFSRPGTGSKPTGGAGNVPEPTSGGGGSTTKPGTRLTAAAAIAILGVSMALNGLINLHNRSLINDEYERKKPRLIQEQSEDPELGFLMIFRYTGGAVDSEGASANARFDSLVWRRGYTRSETENRWNNEASYDRSAYSYETRWVEPLQAPSPLTISTPWPKVALAQFDDITKIEFQRAQFKEWGGFDTKGHDGPVDASHWADDAGAYRFLVLEMPSQVGIVDVGGHRDTQSVTTGEVAVRGGRVPAVKLGDTWAVTVWPADEPTQRLFANTTDINDKEHKLSTITNVDVVRWLLPEQVRFISAV
jgi:hypothetical protein